MSLEIEDGKGAYVTDAFDMNSKLSEEVDNVLCTGWQGKPQDQRSQDDRDHLLEEYGDLHLKDLAKRVMDLKSRQLLKPRLIAGIFAASYHTRMELSLPVSRHIVGIANDLFEQDLRLKNSVILRDHTSSDSED